MMQECSPVSSFWEGGREGGREGRGGEGRGGEGKGGRGGRNREHVRGGGGGVRRWEGVSVSVGSRASVGGREGG